MGFLSSLLPIAGTILGNTILPGIGGAIGGGLGSSISGISGSDVGAAISGGLALRGAEKANEANIASARERMGFERAEAEKLRKWQLEEALPAQHGVNALEAHRARTFSEQMSSTAHQREAADLAAAGLNRILSVSKGGPGASTPSSASASVGAPSGAKGSGAQAIIRDAITPALATARDIKTAEAQIGEVKQRTETEQERTSNEYKLGRKIDAETRLIRAQKFKVTEEAQKVKDVDYDKGLVETEHTAQSIRNAKAQLQVLQEELKGLRVEGQIDQTAYGRLMRYIDRALPTARAATSAGNVARGRLSRR